MSTCDVLDRFEVQLSDDILKNLLEPGKLFKKDLTPRENEDSKSDKLKCPPASLFLEKMAGDVVKIFVTVHKRNEPVIQTAQSSDDTKNKIPVDKCTVEHTSMQTDIKPVDASLTQTDTTVTEDISMQTDKKSEKTQLQQTEKNEGKNQHQQTDKKSEKTQQQQTEKNVGKSQHQQTDKKEEKHQLQQTIKSEYKDSHTQTEHKEYNCTECQTVTTPIVEQDCQTDVKEIVAAVSQTDLSMSLQNENCCQTNISIADQVDGQCQTFIETKNTNCQTEILTTEMEVQATVSSKSILCQATAAMKGKGSQTVSDNKTVIAQTELSMLYQSDQGCQIEVENCTHDSQTEMSIAFMEELAVQASADISESSQQTDVQPQIGRITQTDYLGVYAETQTVPDVNNHEVQTDEVIISLPNLEAPIIQDTVQPEEQQINEVSEEPPPIITEGDDQQQQGINPVTGEMPIVTNIPALQASESGTQTDPVTIIIGDASFLVQKLKSSSLQPTKVSGNEIEIEVGDGSEVTQNGGPIPTSQGTPQTSYRQGRSNQNTPRGTVYSQDSPQGQAVSAVRKSTPKRSPKVQKVIGAKTPYAKLPLGTESTYSCPFCEMTFQESPQLYEHITNSHNEAATKRHKKPKGREGKTIVPRSQGGSQSNRVLASPPYLIPQPVPARPVTTADQRMMVEQEQIIEAQVQSSDADGPPVLEPVYTLSQMPGHQIKTEGTPAKKRKTYVRKQVAVVQEVGLFEDLPNPARSYPRNRVRREEADEEEEENVVVQQLDAYEYECPHCPEKYGSASHLYTHLKRSHKDDMEKNKPQTVVKNSSDQDHQDEDQSEPTDTEESLSKDPAIEETALQNSASNDEGQEQTYIEEENISPKKRKRMSNASGVKKQRVEENDEEAEDYENSGDQYEELIQNVPTEDDTAEEGDEDQSQSVDTQPGIPTNSKPGKGRGRKKVKSVAVVPHTDAKASRQTRRSKRT